jgi:hypothetical protein
LWLGELMGLIVVGSVCGWVAWQCLVGMTVHGSVDWEWLI